MPRKKSVVSTPAGLLKEAILKGILDKKAKDPVVLDFTKHNTALCDAFIICHGTSRTHVEAIAGSVIARVKKDTGMTPWHKEGLENAEWILIDYADVVVHIFQESRRSFYNLELLWADSKITTVSNPE